MITRHTFFGTASLLTLALANSAFAGDVPCGKISDGDLSIPSISFSVRDAQGKVISDLTPVGNINIFHSTWDGDHWGSVENQVPLKVTYDSSSLKYVIAAVDSISLDSSGIFGTCTDVIETYEVKLKDQQGSADFLITFQNDSLDDANTRISQAMQNTDVTYYLTGQSVVSSDVREIEVWETLQADQAKNVSQLSWDELIPFVTTEVQNAQDRLARVLRIGSLGTSGTDDFKNLTKVCAYFAVGAPVHAPDLAQALKPLTTDSFAADVANKNSDDDMSKQLQALIPSCKSAVERNSN